MDSASSLNPEPTVREPGSVRAMFDRIAPRYDFANHLLSGGADVVWRARAAKIVQHWRPERILDLATGSGDLALALQRRLPKADVIAADFSPEMLAIARGKGVRQTLLADALQLPFDEARFDCVTVAFGLRNMSDWTGALREMRRVLAPGGHLLVLDFSLPRAPFRALYRLYLHHVLPHAAALVTRQKDAYDYLGGSIENFPSGTAMMELMSESGFTNTAAVPLTGGIASVYTGAAPATELSQQAMLKGGRTASDWQPQARAANAEPDNRDC